MSEQNIVKVTIPEREMQIHQSVHEAVHFYIQAATSENTRKAYQADIRHFLAWGGKLPCATEDILNYLHAFAKQLNSRTLSRRLVALKNWHCYQGFNDPSANPLVRKTLAGIQQTHGKPKERACAITIDLLKKITCLLNTGSIVDLRNNALLQIGFFAALRRSELTKIMVQHIAFVEEGLDLLIPKSKTDQIGEGQRISIPYAPHPNLFNLCAVTALKKWIDTAHLTEGYIFRPINKKGQIGIAALTDGSVNLIIKQCAKLANFDHWQTFSGHSLRRGFATSASQKGASMSAIMRQGRWRHQGTVHDYIQEGQRFIDNAADVLLSDNASQP